MRSSFFLLLLAAVALAQTASQLQTDEIRRVGTKLACLCGTCKNTVSDCPMLECHFAKPARMRIASLQAAGKSDSEIIDGFVEEYGKQIFAVPPAEGFNLLAWTMPFVAIVFGLAMIWLFVRRFQKPPAESPVDSKTFLHYQERIEKDLSKLD